MPEMIRAIRGMRDILPPLSHQWQKLEGVLRNLVIQYGYHEIRTPILEKTALFKRSIGEGTDIIEKEMYTFLNRHQESLSLRPEGTASCLRAGIQHGLLHNQLQRLWYMGPMFRHERPQKGRYRQFQQFGVEAFGMPNPDIDAELICMSTRLWKLLGLMPNVSLQINSLGSRETRSIYRKRLIDYFKSQYTLLDEDSKRRLENNPLRILDSKNPTMQTLIEKAPRLQDNLDGESQEHFQQLKNLLQAANISFTINPYLVRGLDYYNKTVFEWVITKELSAQNTLCAGGRYDGLALGLGLKKALPAIGFAIGLERVIELMEQTELYSYSKNLFYFILMNLDAKKQGLLLAEELRTALSQTTVLVDCGSGDLKNQLKRAEKIGAQFALILGQKELDSKSILFKPMREHQDQMRIDQNKLVTHVQKLIT